MLKSALIKHLLSIPWRGREDLNLRGAFYTPYSLSRGAPSASWVLPQAELHTIFCLAERVGFEPTDAFTSPVFKTGAFNRSAISPDLVPRLPQTQLLIYHITSPFVKQKSSLSAVFLFVSVK